MKKVDDAPVLQAMIDAGAPVRHRRFQLRSSVDLRGRTLDIANCIFDVYDPAVMVTDLTSTGSMWNCYFFSVTASGTRCFRELQNCGAQTLPKVEAA